MQKQINKDWFLERIDEKRTSVRALAKALNMDPASASRMLNGKRRMQMEEANAIAMFLDAPTAEVLKHAGMAVDLDGEPTKILLAAIINANGQIERLKEPRPLPPSFVERAQAAIEGSNQSIIAAQVRALEGPLSVMDDAVVLFSHTDNVEASAVGTLSICRTYDGEQILAKLERARITGEARLTRTDGKVEEVMLRTATPVLAIMP